jgi:hypothetical protein
MDMKKARTMAGGGAVVLDASGITLQGNEASPMIKLMDGLDTGGYLYAIGNFLVLKATLSLALKTGGGNIIVYDSIIGDGDGTRLLGSGVKRFHSIYVVRGFIDQLEKNLDFQTFQALQLTLENRAGDPVAPAIGQIWFRNDL